MVKSLFLAALLSVARLSHARPTGADVLFQMEQMEQMKLGVEEYNRNLPEWKYQAMSKVVEESNKESAVVACPKAILVFARGTFEPGGLNNLGSLVGGPFFNALRAAIPGIQGAGVPYSNDVFGYLIGYLGGTTPGSSIMAKQLKDKVAECPNIKIIAGGYSQGAQVTHQALISVSQEVKDHIAAVIVFGDPMNGAAIPGVGKEKIYTNCAASDPICAYLPIPIGAHLTYGSDSAGIRKTVEFAKNHMSTKSDSAPKGESSTETPSETPSETSTEASPEATSEAPAPKSTGKSSGKSMGKSTGQPSAKPSGKSGGKSMGKMTGKGS